MTDTKLIERIDSIILDIDRMDGRSLYVAKEKLRALKPDLTAAQKRIEELSAKLVSEREENLWNAYNVGHERDGRWHHNFMSDGEWLATECGMDAKAGQYDAQSIKDAIPKVARAALRESE